MKNSLAVTVLMMVLGCTHTSGAKMNIDDVSKLKAGVSTYADAKALFGDAKTVVSNGLGGTCYGWTYVKVTTFSSNYESQVISLCFDSNGKYQQTPGYQTGQKMNMDDVSKLKPGVSTYPEAKGMFGEPQSAVGGTAGSVCYSWLYVKAPVAGKSESQTVALCFDAKGLYQGPG